MQRCYKAGRGLPYLFGQEHGIIPPDGNETRNKFFVVLGYDADYVYGGVVMNSRVNRNLRNPSKIITIKSAVKDILFCDTILSSTVPLS